MKMSPTPTVQPLDPGLAFLLPAQSLAEGGTVQKPQGTPPGHLQSPLEPFKDGSALNFADEPSESPRSLSPARLSHLGSCSTGPSRQFSHILCKTDLRRGGQRRLGRPLVPAHLDPSQASQASPRLAGAPLPQVLLKPCTMGSRRPSWGGRSRAPAPTASGPSLLDPSPFRSSQTVGNPLCVSDFLRS